MTDTAKTTAPQEDWLTRDCHFLTVRLAQMTGLPPIVLHNLKSGRTSRPSTRTGSRSIPASFCLTARSWTRADPADRMRSPKTTAPPVTASCGGLIPGPTSRTSWPSSQEPPTRSGRRCGPPE